MTQNNNNLQTQIETKILDIIQNNNPKSYGKILRSEQNAHILSYLQNRYGDLPFSELLYLFYHNLDFPPKCNNNKKIVFHSFNRGYRKFCGNPKYCPCNNQNFANNIKNKPPEWFSRRYEKIREANLEKYGVESTLELEEVQEKIKKTNQQRYGYENPLQSPRIREGIKNTVKKKYGVDNVFRAEKIKNKTRETNKARYGAPHILQTKEYKEKFAKTIQMKYGRRHQRRIHLDKETEAKLDNLEYLKLEHHKNRKSLSLIAHELGVTPSAINQKFIKNNIPVYSNTISREQKEVATFIKSVYGGKIEENVRSVLRGTELDVFLPEINLAVEYCGLYWHCHRTLCKRMAEDLARDFHRAKLEKCLEKGIQLITIFSDEWNDTEKRKEIENILFAHMTHQPNLVYEKLLGNETIEVDRRFDEGKALLELGYDLSESLPPKSYFILGKFEKRILSNSLEEIHCASDLPIIYDCGWHVYKKKR